jgi:hypothetical protein
LEPDGVLYSRPLEQCKESSASLRLPEDITLMVREQSALMAPIYFAVNQAVFISSLE